MESTTHVHLTGNKKIAKNWLIINLQQSQIYATKFGTKTGVNTFKNLLIIFSFHKKMLHKSCESESAHKLQNQVEDVFFTGLQLKHSEIF